MEKNNVYDFIGCESPRGGSYGHKQNPMSFYLDGKKKCFFFIIIII